MAHPYLADRRGPGRLGLGPRGSPDLDPKSRCRTRRDAHPRRTQVVDPRGPLPPHAVGRRARRRGRRLPRRQPGVPRPDRRRDGERRDPGVCGPARQRVQRSASRPDDPGRGQRPHHCRREALHRLPDRPRPEADPVPLDRPDWRKSNAGLPDGEGRGGGLRPPPPAVVLVHPRQGQRRRFLDRIALPRHDQGDGQAHRRRRRGGGGAEDDGRLARSGWRTGPHARLVPSNHS